MTKDQIKKTLRIYDDKLAVSGIEPIRDTNAGHLREHHIRWMCQEMLEWPLFNEGIGDPAEEAENKEKANRWLGFIQGVLWAECIYTIDEMRDHNHS